MITIAILTTVTISGAVAGLVVLLRLGIDREETDYSLHGEPATRAAALTRRIVGWRGPMPQSPQADHPADRVKARQG
jgi:hypothetical protein